MSETRRKLEQAGKGEDSVPPKREDILRMSLGFRPGDPFESMVKFKMAQYADNLKWLTDNRPIGKPIHEALFSRCEHLTREYLRLAEQSAVPDTLRQLQNVERFIHDILYWIKPNHGEPLSGQELENYALLMDMFGVPLLNAHMALAKARRNRRGAKIVLPRDIVISAAEMRLEKKSWGRIAKAFPKFKQNSLRKSVAAFDKFCAASGISMPAIPVQAGRGKN
jgi:hypothetical protein